jgi:hypothetical protein
MSHCQVCGRQAETKLVAFHQNIGALVIRFRKTVRGQLCRECASEVFRKFQLTNFFLGWWGVISLFMTPILITGNWIAWLRTRSLAAPPERHQLPESTTNRTAM